MPHHFLELAIIIFVAAMAAVVSSRLRQLAFSPLWMKILQRFVEVAYRDKSATALMPAISRCLKPPARLED